MKIAIVGAGISGISTALELALDGHQVTVYEQLNATAESASFAPGGSLSPCLLQSLGTPGMSMRVQELRNSALALMQASGLIGSTSWRWLRQWQKREKLSLQHHDWGTAQALQQMAQYSNHLRQTQNCDLAHCAEQRTGTLVLLRHPQDVDLWSQRLPLLQEWGIPCKFINIEQARHLEPGLGHQIPWLGAIHFTEGESINLRLWTQHLRSQAVALGVHLHTSSHVESINTQPLGVTLEGQLHTHDAVVLCTGSNTQLLQRTSLTPYLMPVWGYSVTAPVRDALHAPLATTMDWTHQATISRMGQRIRITAGLELNSTANAEHHHPTLQRMYNLLNDCFPGGAHLSSSQVQVWRGARGTLPDGLPAVGATATPGLWVNMAHGSHGAALAAGCARALADSLQGRTSEVNLAPFSPQRFAR